MRLADLSNALVIILGYGREGKAIHEVLKSHVPAARIIVTDEKTIDIPEFLSLADVVALATPETIVIKSPGIPWHRDYVIALQNAGAQFTSSTNLFLAERKGRGTIIGITGTKGKSTTASLLAHVLKTSGRPVVFAGNIGDPAIAHVDDTADTIFVLEMSSYQLADLAIAPDIALIVNLYEEHMDWHGSVESYHAAKTRIAELQIEGDVFVYNEKFPQLANLAGRVRSTPIPFIDRADHSLDALTLLGEHNRENAAGVLAVCDVLGIDRAVVESAFSTFQPLPHRMQDIGIHHGIHFINDSISTTPQSALAAIDVFNKDLGAIILGGQDRGYHFADLAQRVVDLGIAIYILPGGDRIADAIAAVGGTSISMKTLTEIVQHVVAHAKSGSVCLLSPASPSYGQFLNFEDRGQQFIAAVEK